jgi:hypothetical protein
VVRLEVKFVLQTDPISSVKALEPHANVRIGLMSTHIIGLLVAERDRIEAAIAALQGSASPGSEAAGESIVVQVQPKAEAAPARKKRKLSAAGRKAIVAATKKRWAAIKAAKAAETAPAAGKVAPAKAPAPAKHKRSAAKDAAFRKKMSERMKAAWAAKKNAAKAAK